jgi:uncharacterized protein YkwD
MVGGYPSAIVQEYEKAPLSETQEYMLAQVNATRAKFGLRPVILDTTLSCAARTWSKRVWRLNICAHVDPVTGQQFWQRVELCGGRLVRGGWEIVACGYPGINYAITGWLRSPSHRAVLLNPSVTNVGIGVAGPPYTQSERFYTIVAAR